MAVTSLREFADYSADLLQSIGPVYVKRMFSGYGLFLEGLMIAIVVDNSLYLKADEDSRNDFADEGLEPFIYRRKGKPYALSFWQAPEEVFENQEAMNKWGNKAYGAALRSAAKRARPGKAKNKSRKKAAPQKT
jgi:DNA transformation protein